MRIRGVDRRYLWIEGDEFIKGYKPKEHISLREMLRIETNLDNIIIITDEMTWAEDYSIKEMNKLLPNNLKERVILYNTDYDGTGAFKREHGILKLAGIEGKVLLAIKMFYDFNSFKQTMVEDFLRDYKSSIIQ